ncbi:RNA polymerase factor sigma-70 [Marvinbryantia formatexigens DSM 14469]|uniref:RNA polymerase factor sigma-70 n=1 Tax=Marvinbryantia formatexigens DSM 14469 TaxID=478749 RepID=C6L8S8_9FIRM|nr:sigma-70 family RNA polymerase sigma factor [Marvinbryantia formatexigens]EET62667.1 RNA polymerase factor sigma-70 [Marvinbryantia formatexigens DSM 14469]UWO23045.1 sigma-70 family RNA polymerase sigma factor [Marvinbryantia formatexigens DSM 14469]SDF97013.1 RNA polymerase sigma-70 factor, ECF subfamily [Marvinbryantia formatexigens]
MDEDIMELLVNRDQQGIVLIEQRYEKLIRYIAVTILRGRDTVVEECINDVYLKLWNHAAEFDCRKASFKTYLKAVTRNTALNHLRKLRRLEELEGLDEEDTLQSEYIDYSQGPEQKMIFREEVEALRRVLAGLKQKDREIVLRRFYYLQSTRQIAMGMGMSENAVDSKLSRLKKKIRKHYEKEVAE